MKWRRPKIPQRKKKMKHRTMQRGFLAFLEEHKPEYIIGLDEVGWGAIAGPVVVGCSVYKTHVSHRKIRDSKRYSSHKSREKGLQVVYSTAEYTEHYEADVDSLTAKGAGAALQDLFRTAATDAIARYPNSVVVMDGSNLIKDFTHPQIALPKADDFVTAVSAASIVAKVYRDGLMIKLGKQFPEYEWYENKGYGTPRHLTAMREVGVCLHHRRNIDVVLVCEKEVGEYSAKKAAV